MDLSLTLVDALPAAGPIGTPGVPASDPGDAFANLVGLAVDDGGQTQAASAPGLSWPVPIGAWIASLVQTVPTAEPGKKSASPSAGAVSELPVDPAPKAKSDDEAATQAIEALSTMTVPIATPQPALVALPTEAATAVTADETGGHATGEPGLNLASAVNTPASTVDGGGLTAKLETPHTPALPIESRADENQISNGAVKASEVPSHPLPNTSSGESAEALRHTPAIESASLLPKPTVDGQSVEAEVTPKSDRGASPEKSSMAAVHHASTTPTRQSETSIERSTSTTVQESASGATPAHAVTPALSSGTGHESADQRPADHRSPSPQTIAAIAAHLGGSETPLTATAGAGNTGSSAGVISAALSEDNGRAVLDQLVHAFRMQFKDGIGEAVVKLKPEQLGDVTISLRLDRGQVSANVQAELPAVRQWLESQESAVRQALAQHGLNLERFVISRDPQSRQEKQHNQAPQGRRRRQSDRSEEAPRFEITV